MVRVLRNTVRTWVKILGPIGVSLYYVPVSMCFVLCSVADTAVALYRCEARFAALVACMRSGALVARFGQHGMSSCARLPVLHLVAISGACWQLLKLCSSAIVWLLASAPVVHSVFKALALFVRSVLKRWPLFVLFVPF